MLKIKDNVDIKELEKFGFRYLYNEHTGEIEETFKSENLYGLHFIKKNKKTINICKIKNRWYIDDNILWDLKKYHSFDFDTLYDLIKADLVEKEE